MNDFNQLLSNIFQSAQGVITFGVPVPGVAATSTVTITDYTQASGWGVTIDDQTLTEGVDWTAATSDEATAQSFADAVNNNITLQEIVSATVDGAVVTLTVTQEGPSGNDIVVSTTATGGLTVSGNTAGGAYGDSIALGMANTFYYVSGSANAVSNEFNTAAELASLIDGLASYIAVDNEDGTITVSAASPGIAGNSLAMSLGESNTGTMSVSGSTLSGGVAANYTNSFELDENANSLNLTLTTANFSGTSPTLTFTAQFSVDGENWVDFKTFEALSANGVYPASVECRYKFFRGKIVLTGELTTVDLTVKITQNKANLSEVGLNFSVLSIDSGDTAYPYTIPANCKGLMMKERMGGSFRISKENDGTPSEYYTVGSGGLTITDLNVFSDVLYFSSSGGFQTIEIIEIAN